VASATYDAANEQTTFAGATLQYDANGNLTNDGTNTYVWDARNRLVSMSGGATANFQYDVFGRRVSKSVNSVGGQYIYDGINILSEIGGGAVSATYLQNIKTDERFVQQTAGGANFFHADRLGSTLSLTSQNSASLTSYSYDSFGKTTSANSLSNPFQFTGRENDLTGLYYYRARYYHPNLQRFISEDPVRRLAGQINFYAYVGNDPVNGKDPLGLWKIWWHNRATRAALARCGFSDQDIQTAVLQNSVLDLAHQQDNEMHYMPEHEEEAQAFLQSEYRVALGAARAGDRAGAMQHLGRALHTTQDYWAHAGNSPQGTWGEHMKGPFGSDPDDPFDHPDEWASAIDDSIALVELFVQDTQGGRKSSFGATCK
jgi:RHS repeat-associated protein